MKDMIKKYMPYAAIIFAVFLLVPLIFVNDALSKYSAVAYYFILLITQVACCAVFCAKRGLDFLFALVAPISFLFTMMIYAGGFTNPTNFILLAVYLVSGIFGLFLGDLAFGDERRKKEAKEKKEAENFLLRAKRRDERERRRMSESGGRSDSHAGQRYRSQAQSKGRRYSDEGYTPRHTSNDDDDFDYDKYL